jgi:ribosomal protein L24
MPIQISNLSYYDPLLKKGVRLGYKLNDKKEKIRFNKDSGKVI